VDLSAAVYQFICAECGGECGFVWGVLLSIGMC
jgi:hypothetical protein